MIDGNLVYVYSQDASVLNGTIGEMHAKKIANIYDMAMKMGAPVIGLIDCAGLRLQEATDALKMCIRDRCGMGEDPDHQPRTVSGAYPGRTGCGGR